MKEVIKENWAMILTLGFMFLVGVGLGGAITDAIRGMKDEKKTIHKDQTDKTAGSVHKAGKGSSFIRFGRKDWG